MGLTRETLDHAKCSTAGETHECRRESGEPLWFHARCHPSAGTRDAYLPARGVLVIQCRKCETFVAEIEVAP